MYKAKRVQLAVRWYIEYLLKLYINIISIATRYSGKNLNTIAFT